MSDPISHPIFTGRPAKKPESDPVAQVWIVCEFQGGGIRGVYRSQEDAERGIDEIRREHPDLHRADFIVQVERIRPEAALGSSPADNKE